MSFVQLSPLILILDIAVCTVLLRIIFGWLWNYPRLVRLLLILASFALFGGFVNFLELPFASLFVTYVLIPVILVTLLSYLPDLTRIYKAASYGTVFRSECSSQKELIPELAATLREMSSLRRGAILVLSGKEPLDDLVSGGEAVEAAFNRSLVLSIFDTHCPRHDGAIILRGDRIVRIGAVLPLASAEGRDASLGTRHLASLGLSQVSDAHVLVVSEERGTVSHVHGGHVSDLPASSEDEMEAALYDLLKVSSPDKEKVGQSKHEMMMWGGALAVAALASLGLSALRSAATHIRPEALVSVEGNMRLTNIPEGLFASEMEPTVLTIWLNVSEDEELEDRYTILVDAANWGAQEHVVDLTAKMVEELPDGVTVSRFIPAKARVELAEAKRTTLIIRSPEVLNAQRTVRSVDVVPAELEVVVRDPEWRGSEHIPPPVDISEYTSPGVHKVEFDLSLPAYIELAPKQEPPELVVELEGEGE